MKQIGCSHRSSVDLRYCIILRALSILKISGALMPPWQKSSLSLFLAILSWACLLSAFLFHRKLKQIFSSISIRISWLTTEFCNRYAYWLRAKVFRIKLRPNLESDLLFQELSALMRLFIHLSTFSSFSVWLQFFLSTPCDRLL